MTSSAGRISIGTAAALCLTLAGTLGAQAPASPPPPDRTAYAFARDSAFARPVNRSFIAFTIPRRDLLAENVAFSPRDSAFYVGSTRWGNVTRRARDGRITELVPSGRDGMWMVIGLKADERRNALWVNSSGGGNYVRHRAEDGGRAGLFRYDLTSGAFQKRWLPAEPGPHFFNDLVIAPDGDVLLTDMAAGAIYRVDARDSLATWLPAGTFRNPNGIALSGDGRSVFVASRAGIARIDRATRTVTPLASADSVDALGIDGLYWHRGALIGVQGGRRNRVQRFTLDDAGTRITAARVLEAHHPMFMNPTTGVLVGDTLFVVANSQFSSFTPDGQLFPMERLFETVILAVPLE